jgi:hypothetical protein
MISGTQPVTSVDIVIVKRPLRDGNGNPNPEGEMETGGGRPFKLFVREDLLDRMNDTNLAAVVAHELAHRIGLADTQCGGTLMQNIQPQADGSLTMPQTTVSAQDVFHSRVNYSVGTRGTCTKLDAKMNYLDAEGAAGASCTDNDNDGVSTCDGDCDDYNPSLNWDCSGGGGGGNCTISELGEIGNYTCDHCWDNWDNDCNGDKDFSDFDCSNCYPSPIVVDVLGDGFNFSGAEGGVVFDISGTGHPVHLGWPTGDDAWLSLDRDGDGMIASGRELFGNYTPQPEPPRGEQRNGFLALAEFDKPENSGNADGVLDSQDSVFASLRLWQDANRNGVSEASELHTLPTLGLKSIDLDYKTSQRTDGYGNQFRYRAKVRDVKGANVNRWAWDVFPVFTR